MVCPFPIAIPNPAPRGVGFSRFMHVGCGSCGACKHNKRSEWSFRIKQEARHADSLYFLTLTYHDSTLKHTDNFLPTLVPSHLQTFLKDIRKEQAKLSDRTLRFFGVGEYGTLYSRPHYHVLLFNLIPELSCPGKLTEIWWHGIVHKEILDQGLTHYATKYHVTTENGERHLSYTDDRVNEFTRSSNKPPDGGMYGGIGYQYINTHGDYHRKTKTTFVINDGFKQKMPKYYFDAIFKDLSDVEKAKMREESFKRFSEKESKELKRLSEIGYDNPEQELLHRVYWKQKNVIHKAKKKGIF